MNTDPIIREEKSEEELLGRAFVHWKSWHETYTGIVAPAYLDGLTLPVSQEISRQNTDGIRIALDGGRVVGFVGFGPCRHADLPDAGEIYALYLLRSHQGRGIGRRLMEEALRQLGDYPRVAVTVLKENHSAIRFYERCGFRCDGCEAELTLGRPVTELRMILVR